MAQSTPETRARPATPAVRELYDNFLRAAVARFFEQATIQRDAPGPTVRDRPFVELGTDRSTLAIEWLGWRYVVRGGADHPFNPNDARLASAIVLPLAARYRAVLDPDVMAEKEDLFQGAIEDRVVGAFLDPRPYEPDAPPALVDRVARALEVLRVAAVSSYENRPISTGFMLLGGDAPRSAGAGPGLAATPYWELVTTAKSLFRLADGVHSLFLVDRNDVVIDLIDIDRWTANASTEPLAVPCAQVYVPHARATLGTRNVCVVLSPAHEMKVFAEGAQLFAFRNANWRLLDLALRFREWSASLDSPDLADRLFRTALDLADARRGALFVVLRDPSESAPRLLAVSDRLDLDVQFEGADALASRRELLRLLAGRSVVDLPRNVLCALAAIDGAIVTDSSGALIAAGAILRHPPGAEADQTWIAEGARTTAAIAASRFGPVLKVSEDGVITFYDRRKIWEI